VLNFKNLIGPLCILFIYGVSIWSINKWELVTAGLFGICVAILIVKKNWVKNLFSLLAFSLPLSSNLSLGGLDLMLPAEWIIGVLALVLLFDTFNKKNYQLILKNPLPALWVISFVVPLVFSSMFMVSLKFTLLNGVFVFTFFYGTLRFGKGEVFKWLKLYSIAFFLSALWGGYQFLNFDSNPDTISGAFKPFYYSNTYVGAVAALLSGFAIGIGRIDKRCFAMAIIALAIMIFSESRAALISFMVMLIAYLFSFFSLKIRLIGPALLIMIVFVFGSKNISESFTYNKIESHNPDANIFEETLSVTNIQSDVSNIERLNRWLSALKMFQDKPHWGFGPGTYQFTYIPFQESKLMNRLSVRNPDDIPKGSGGSAHSELLLQLSENGWPSTAIFVTIFLVWIYRGYLSIGELQIQRLPFFLGLITYAFHMNVNNFLNQPGFAFLFWTFGALLMSPELLSHKTEDEN
jgi:putative inorganic carbon (HCO3(-)) transporter